MLYAISHWHAGWHDFVTLAGFVLWLVGQLALNWPRSDGGRAEAERRGRERIMGSYDKYDRRADGD